MKRIYFGMIPVPWIFATLLFLNGKLDTSRPDSGSGHGRRKIRNGRVLPRSRRLVVTSWRTGAEWNESPWIKTILTASNGETTS